MLPSISHFEARSRIVAWHKQPCKLFDDEVVQASVKAPNALQ
jgi:hypothetical protein